jgi:hypothetical protein
VLSDLITPIADAMDVEHSIGAEKLLEHSAPPRVVWVPTKDRYDGPIQQSRTVRSLFTCHSGYDVHLWGESFDAARELRRSFLEVLMANAIASFEIGAGEWVGFDRPRWLKSGEVYVLSLTIMEPITAAPKSLVTVTSVAFDSTGAVPGDNVLQAGEG